MALEANIVYLEEELKNNSERLTLMIEYLKENPSLSIYRRKISGRFYYYKKYWKNDKSVSEFLCKDEAEYKKHLKKITAANKKRRRVKEQYKKLKQVTETLEKQLRIARKAHKNV